MKIWIAGIMVVAISIVAMAVLDQPTTNSDPICETHDDWLDNQLLSLDLRTGDLKEIERSSIENADAVVFGNEWIRENDHEDVREALISCVSIGAIAVFSDHSLTSYLKDYSICFSAEGKTYAFRYDPSARISYSYEDNIDSREKSVQSMNKWISHDIVPPRTNKFFTGDWECDSFVYRNVDCGEWGSFNVSGTNYYVDEDDHTRNCYSSQFSVETIPAIGHNMHTLDVDGQLFNLGST